MNNIPKISVTTATISGAAYENGRRLPHAVQFATPKQAQDWAWDIAERTGSEPRFFGPDETVPVGFSGHAVEEQHFRDGQRVFERKHQEPAGMKRAAPERLRPAWSSEYYEIRSRQDGRPTMLQERYPIRNQALEALLEKLRATGNKSFEEGTQEDFESATADGLYLVKVKTQGFAHVIA